MRAAAHAPLSKGLRRGFRTKWRRNPRARSGRIRPGWTPPSRPLVWRCVGLRAATGRSILRPPRWQIRMICGIFCGRRIDAARPISPHVARIDTPTVRRCAGWGRGTLPIGFALNLRKFANRGGLHRNLDRARRRLQRSELFRAHSMAELWSLEVGAPCDEPSDDDDQTVLPSELDRSGGSITGNSQGTAAGNHHRGGVQCEMRDRALRGFVGGCPQYRDGGAPSSRSDCFDAPRNNVPQAARDLMPGDRVWRRKGNLPEHAEFDAGNVADKASLAGPEGDMPGSVARSLSKEADSSDSGEGSSPERPPPTNVGVQPANPPRAQEHPERGGEDGPRGAGPRPGGWRVS